jgi:hypothetical protein
MAAPTKMTITPITIHGPQLVLLRAVDGLPQSRQGSGAAGGGKPRKDPPRVPEADREGACEGRWVCVLSSDERGALETPARWLVLYRGPAVDWPAADRGAWGCEPTGCPAPRRREAGSAVDSWGPSERVITGAAGVAVSAGAEAVARETAGGSGVGGGIWADWKSRTGAGAAAAG